MYRLAMSQNRQGVSAWLPWLALAAAAVAAGFLLPWQQVWAALAHAQKAWLLAALAICLAATPVMATQWRLYLPEQYRLAWRRVFDITALTVMARATLPFLGGDASGIGLLMMRGGLSAGIAALVLTLDHLFTGIGKVAMVCATLAFASIPSVIATAGASLAILVAGLLAVLLIAAAHGRSLHGLAETLPPRLASYLSKIADLTGHLELLRHPARASGALTLTLLKKAIEIGVTFSVQHAVGIDLSLGNTILVVTALDLAAVIPGPPSGLGIFEATALFIYHFLGIGAGTAFAGALLLHAVYFTADVGYGYAVLLGQARRKTISDREGMN